MFAAMPLYFALAKAASFGEMDYCEKCSIRNRCLAYENGNPKICQYFNPEE